MYGYIESKYELINDEFWAWFFKDCPWGETNLLGLDKGNEACIHTKYKEYYKILKDDYRGSANDDFCLEIKNDL